MSLLTKVFFSEEGFVTGEGESPDVPSALQCSGFVFGVFQEGDDQPVGMIINGQYFPRADTIDGAAQLQVIDAMLQCNQAMHDEVAQLTMAMQHARGVILSLQDQRDRYKTHYEHIRQLLKTGHVNEARDYMEETSHA